MELKGRSLGTIVLGLAVIAAIATIAIQHWNAVPPQVPEAHAVYFPGWPNCAGGDTTRTSTLRVLHEKPGGNSQPVAPDTQDVWNVTATYSPATPPFTDATYYATVTVTNDGSGYAVSCTGCTTAPFNGVGICDPTECYDGTDYEYTIKLDMDQGDGTGRQIRVAEYSSSSIDNGDTIDDDCDTVSSVSPTSQSWSNSDYTFPCSYDCTSDTLITITYN